MTVVHPVARAVRLPTPGDMGTQGQILPVLVLWVPDSKPPIWSKEAGGWKRRFSTAVGGNREQVCWGRESDRQDSRTKEEIGDLESRTLAMWVESDLPLSWEIPFPRTCLSQSVWKERSEKWSRPESSKEVTQALPLALHPQPTVPTAVTDKWRLLPTPSAHPKADHSGRTGRVIPCPWS